MRNFVIASIALALAACGDAAPSTSTTTASSTTSSIAASSTTGTTGGGNSTTTSASSTTGTTGNSTTASSSTGSTGGNTSSGSTTGGTSAGSVVINEVCGKGTNWIELYNPGGEPTDLGGLGVVDSNDGGLKLSDLVTFPSGMTLPPGGFMLLVGTDDGGFGGPYTDCMGAASSCFYFGFGVSNSKGEHLYLIDANQNTVDDVIYPAHFATADGQTLGRLPDGTGSFVTTAATPAAPNHQ